MRWHLLPLILWGIGCGAATEDVIAEKEMVLVPGGAFGMGCLSGAFTSCAADQQPFYARVLSSFEIDATEVTAGEYQQCVDAGACTPPRCGGDSQATYLAAEELHLPIVCVSWEQAAAHCLWAEKRLPTEAEWEKAARGDGVAQFYPWGNQSPCDLDTCGSCVAELRAVGSQPVDLSPFGVLDMAGNAAEWVHDWYGDTYYGDLAASAEGPVVDPPGPSSGSYRVVRGGTFNIGCAGAHVYDRGLEPPTGANASIGFRCARTAGD